MEVRDSVAGPTASTGASPALSVRANQARATRHAIVAAAGALFVERGYAATTIDAVAQRAGVGRKTVFSSVGGKGALLKLAWDWAIAGDDEPLAMSARPGVQAILAEHDPDRLVRMWVDLQLDVGYRATPIGVVVLAAADVDADAQALLDLIRRETLVGATAFVTHVADVGGLRPGLSVERAADVCWALVNAMLLPLLVTARRWPPQEYREWMVHLVSATLLDTQRTPPPADQQGVQIVHDAPRERFVASLEGRVVGHLSYQRTTRLMVLTRTHVEPGHSEHGVADALVRAALDDLRTDSGPQVLAICPFTQWWIGNHPDYAHLLHDPTTS